MRRISFNINVGREKLSWSFFKKDNNFVFNPSSDIFIMTMIANNYDIIALETSSKGRKKKKKLKKIVSNLLLVGSKNDAATKVRAYQEKKKSPCSGFQLVAGTPSCQSTDHSASSRESFSIESTDASPTNLHDSGRFCRFENATEQRLGFGYRMRIRFRVERICAIVE